MRTRCPGYSTVTYLGIDVGNLLYRTTFSTSTMACRHDAAIGALAKLLDEFVFRIDDKGRVQGGKCSSGHVSNHYAGENVKISAPISLYLVGGWTRSV